MTKLIGIPADKHDNTFGVNINYMEFASQFGDVVMLTPNTNSEIKNDLDLLILPGGADVYVEQPYPGYMNTRSNPHLEWFDQIMLPQYIRNRTPIFSICRGFQSLNLLFGGSIYQHITGHIDSQYDQYQGKNSVKQTQNSTAEEVTNTFKINSSHHQAINELGEGLVVTLISTENRDGIIEGYRHTELPIQGVQYHPEKIYDEYSYEIIKQLLNGYNQETKETIQEDQVFRSESEDEAPIS